MIKILLKFWPSLLILFLYLFYILFLKDKFKQNHKDNKNDKKSKLSKNFSLENKNFVIILFISLIFAIFSLIFLSFNQNLRQTQPDNLKDFQKIKIK